MRSNRWLTVAVSAALAAITLSTPAARGDEPAPREGQLRGILSALNRNGDAWARHGTEWLLQREYVAHMLFLETDPRGGTGGGGWYRASQGRHGWEWLRQRCDRNGDGVVTLEEFAGPREWFEALDKDRDGVLTKDDFDWAADSAIVRASARVRPLFETIDRDASGRVTLEEWNQWFEALGGGKGYVSQDDLIPLFLERAAPKRPPMPPANAPISKTRLAVICAYLSGDVGSLSEGPAVGEKAPQFSLRTVDGKRRVSFPSGPERRDKPLVLIFGSFT
jgi:hypothetical protein